MEKEGRKREWKTKGKWMGLQKLRKWGKKTKGKKIKKKKVKKKKRGERIRRIIKKVRGNGIGQFSQSNPNSVGWPIFGKND